MQITYHIDWGSQTKKKKYILWYLSSLLKYAVKSYLFILFSLIILFKQFSGPPAGGSRELQ